MAQTPDDDGSSKLTSQLKRFVIEHYDELHTYAIRQIALEAPGQSMDATALLHEAVVKILEPEKPVAVNNADHFKATAKLIMKHILIDRARHKGTDRAGGQFQRQPLHADLKDGKKQPAEFLIFQEELQVLATKDPLAAKVVELHCNGYSIADVAKQLNISRSSAYDLWKFGRAWLMRSCGDAESEDS
jgi:RNA polymerase sigma factor (TIGR02999 family)